MRSRCSHRSLKSACSSLMAMGTQFPVVSMEKYSHLSVDHPPVSLCVLLLYPQELCVSYNIAWLGVCQDKRALSRIALDRTSGGMRPLVLFCRFPGPGAVSRQEHALTCFPFLCYCSPNSTVQAMLLPLPYLGDPCSGGVLTLCGMEYRTPQRVWSHGTPRFPPLSGALSGVLV